MFETLLTVNIKCLKELDHIASVHIAYYFLIENSKHSRLTHKITWTFSVSFFFLLDFTTSEFIPLLCSNLCFLFICLFVVVVVVFQKRVVFFVFGSSK